jgi:hypothetical protein
MIAHHNIRRNKFIGSSKKLAWDALQPQVGYYPNTLFAYSMMNFHQNSQWSYELNIDAFMNVQSKSNKWSWH